MADPRFFHDSTSGCLAHVVEECGEVLAAIGKSQRFGLDSTNPFVPFHQQITNREWLGRELADLKGAIKRLEDVLSNSEHVVTPCPIGLGKDE